MILSRDSGTDLNRQLVSGNHCGTVVPYGCEGLPIMMAINLQRRALLNVMMLGAGAMALISMNWPDRMRVIAVLAAGSGVLMLSALLWMAHHWKGVLKAVQ